MTIQSILAERGDSVPQPEGREVADAYRDGAFTDENQLYVISKLLHDLRAKNSD